MFPRNENQNEGTFAKTTLLETALLAPNDPFWWLTKGWFPKGWFRRMFRRNENRNEGTFAKTTLLRNRPFISQRFCGDYPAISPIYEHRLTTFGGHLCLSGHCLCLGTLSKAHPLQAKAMLSAKHPRFALMIASAI